MSATTMAAWAERLYDAYIFDMDGTIYSPVPAASSRSSAPAPSRCAT